MPYVCVFAGARPGRDPSFLDAARRLGRGLAEASVGVVYGGASVGLMGALADGALEAGGEVVAVVPEGLRLPGARHPGVSDLREVPSLFERKREMFRLASAFAALPGGTGTVDEVMEVLAWSQLGMEGVAGKPLLLMDAGGHFGPLAAMLSHLASSGFALPEDVARARLVPEGAFLGELLSAIGRP